MRRSIVIARSRAPFARELVARVRVDGAGDDARDDARRDDGGGANVPTDDDDDDRMTRRRPRLRAAACPRTRARAKTR